MKVFHIYVVMGSTLALANGNAAPASNELMRPEADVAMSSATEQMRPEQNVMAMAENENTKGGFHGEESAQGMPWEDSRRVQEQQGQDGSAANAEQPSSDSQNLGMVPNVDELSRDRLIQLIREYAQENARLMSTAAPNTDQESNNNNGEGNQPAGTTPSDEQDTAEFGNDNTTDGGEEGNAEGQDNQMTTPDEDANAPFADQGQATGPPEGGNAGNMNTPVDQASISSENASGSADMMDDTDQSIPTESASQEFFIVDSLAASEVADATDAQSQASGLGMSAASAGSEMSAGDITSFAASMSEQDEDNSVAASAESDEDMFDDLASESGSSESGSSLGSESMSESASDGATSSARVSSTILSLLLMTWFA